VDADHFDPDRLQAGSLHAVEAERLQGHLPRPLLGFFGVIDERLDTALVEAVADARPEWSIVMVGPVVKIDPAALPRRPNLHWLGMQPYERLPHLLAGWDVALMPFARNESTRFISPTKTLEYMAGGKPVVSTPITDVVSLYGDAVEVADGPQAFVQACERLLAEPLSARDQRAAAMAGCVVRHTWNDGADTVHVLLSQALRLAHPAHMSEALASEPMPLAAVGGLRN
jgi:glycosyltransferase involved in cell wall biosynthesis